MIPELPLQRIARICGNSAHDRPVACRHGARFPGATSDLERPLRGGNRRMGDLRGDRDRGWTSGGWGRYATGSGVEIWIGYATTGDPLIRVVFDLHDHHLFVDDRNAGDAARTARGVDDAASQSLAGGSGQRAAAYAELPRMRGSGEWVRATPGHLVRRSDWLAHGTPGAESGIVDKVLAVAGLALWRVADGHCFSDRRGGAPGARDTCWMHWTWNQGPFGGRWRAGGGVGVAAAADPILAVGRPDCPGHGRVGGSLPATGAGGYVRDPSGSMADALAARTPCAAAWKAGAAADHGRRDRGVDHREVRSMPPAAGETADEGTAPERRGSATIEGAALAIWGLSVVAPVVLFALNLRHWRSLGWFWTNSSQAIGTSIRTAAVVGATTSAIAAGAWAVRSCRLRAAKLDVSHLGMWAFLTGALIPGVLVGLATLAFWNSAIMPRAAGDSMWPIVCAHIARFGFLGVLGGWWLAGLETPDERGARLMAAGETLRGWAALCVKPQMGHAVIGLGLAAAATSLHEIESTVLLKPAGQQSLAEQLLNDLHYNRNDELCAACMNLMAVGTALAACAGWLVGRVQARGRGLARVGGAVGLRDPQDCPRTQRHSGHPVSGMLLVGPDG